MKYLGSYMYNYNILYSFMFPPGPALTKNLKSCFIPVRPPPYALSPPAQNYTCFPKKESEWENSFKKREQHWLLRSSPGLVPAAEPLRADSSSTEHRGMQGTPSSTALAQNRVNGV